MLQFVILAIKRLVRRQKSQNLLSTTQPKYRLNHITAHSGHRRTPPLSAPTSSTYWTIIGRARQLVSQFPYRLNPRVKIMSKILIWGVEVIGFISVSWKRILKSNFRACYMNWVLIFCLWWSTVALGLMANDPSESQSQFPSGEFLSILRRKWLFLRSRDSCIWFIF